MRRHFQIFLAEFQLSIHKFIDWVGAMREEGWVQWGDGWTERPKRTRWITTSICCADLQIKYNYSSVSEIALPPRCLLAILKKETLLAEWYYYSETFVCLFVSKYILRIYNSLNPKILFPLFQNLGHRLKQKSTNAILKFFPLVWANWKVNLIKARKKNIYSHQDFRHDVQPAPHVKSISTLS